MAPILNDLLDEEDVFTDESPKSFNKENEIKLSEKDSDMEVMN